jgi:hypothetical protein
MAKKNVFIKLGFLVAKFLQLFNNKIARFLYWVPASSKFFEGILNLFLLSYPVYTQFWLNFIMDDCQFGNPSGGQKGGRGFTACFWLNSVNLLSKIVLIFFHCFL